MERQIKNNMQFISIMRIKNKNNNNNWNNLICTFNKLLFINVQLFFSLFRFSNLRRKI